MHFEVYGQRVDMLGKRYVLRDMLGRGGMAEAWLAYDQKSRHSVAIKLLKDEGVDEQTRNRFIKEAGQIVGWQHSHILQIYDHVQTHETHLGTHSAFLLYMVMEYASGGDLSQRLLPEKPYAPLSEVFTIFRHMCDAVQYAHAHGIIHRDIKPQNILFRQPPTGPQEAVLADFGLAVQVGASHHTFAEAGTLAYMAPEQVRGQAEPASDIFALGVTLYRLCTGYQPFYRSFNTLALMATGQEPEPLPPSQLNPALSPALDQPILRALEADPAARYRHALEFRDALDAALSQTHPGPAAGSVRSSSAPSTDPRSTAPVQGTPTEMLEEATDAGAGTVIYQAQGSAPLVRRASRRPTTPTPLSQYPATSVSSTQFDRPATQPGTPPFGETAIPETRLRHNEPKISGATSPAARTPGAWPPGSSSGLSGAPSPAARTPGAWPPGSSSDPSGSPSHAARTPGAGPPGSSSGSSLRRRWPRLVLPLAGVLVLLLIVLLRFVLLPLLGGGSRVTLLPRTQPRQQTFLLPAHEIHARRLSATASSNTTEAASGSIPATQAQGQLLFQNDTPDPITLQSMTFTSQSGISISFNGPVTIQPPTTSVPAFALQAGAAGNIPPLTISQVALKDAQGTTRLFVKNVLAFRGGKDALPQIQQSDIDRATTRLQSSQQAQQQQAQAQLAAQVQSNEQAIAATLNCAPATQASVQARAQASTVTVTLTVNCNEEVYDRASAQARATSLLSAGAPAGYVLSGQVAVSGTGTNGTGDNAPASIQIDAQGTWIYHFSQDQLKQLALRIAGTSQASARAFLLQQPGIAAAHITGPDPLPSAAQIQMQVQAWSLLTNGQ